MISEGVDSEAPVIKSVRAWQGVALMTVWRPWWHVLTLVSENKAGLWGRFLAGIDGALYFTAFAKSV